MKKHLLSFILLLFSTVCSFGQEIKNVQAKAEGNKVIITYDLISATEGQKFNIELRNSINNFSTVLKEVSGDVGVNQLTGFGKRIVWDALKEQGSFSGNVSFDIIAILTFSPLKITSPTAGSNAKLGKNLNVAWSGGDRSRNLKMAILRGGKTVSEVPNVGSSGTYSWSVPKSIVMGDNYKVKLFDPTKPNDAAMSAEFQLKKTSILVYIIPAAAVLIGVGVAVLVGGGGGGGDCTDVCNPNCPNYNPSDAACISSTDLALPPPPPGGGR
jgi:Kre9/KNH-like N-terminal Ig-like domain